MIPFRGPWVEIWSGPLTSWFVATEPRRSSPNTRPWSPPNNSDRDCSVLELHLCTQFFSLWRSYLFLSQHPSGASGVLLLSLCEIATCNRSTTKRPIASLHSTPPNLTRSSDRPGRLALPSNEHHQQLLRPLKSSDPLEKRSIQRTSVFFPLHSFSSPASPTCFTEKHIFPIPSNGCRTRKRVSRQLRALLWRHLHRLPFRESLSAPKCCLGACCLCWPRVCVAMCPFYTKRRRRPYVTVAASRFFCSS